MNRITLVFKLDAIAVEITIMEICERLRTDGKIGTINRLPGETQYCPFLIVLESSDKKDIFCQLNQLLYDESMLEKDRLLIGNVADKLVALGGYITIELFTRDKVQVNVIYDIIENIVKQYSEVYWLSLGELLQVPSRRSFEGMCVGRGCVL